MKALFVCEFKNGYPVLPPMEAGPTSELPLHYFEGYDALGSPVRHGGYSMVGQVPQSTTAIAQVTTTPTVIAAMQVSTEYFFMTEVVDAPTVVILHSSKPVSSERQKKLKDFLKAKGHDKNNVDNKKWANEDELTLSVLELNGVMPEEYRAAGGI